LDNGFQAWASRPRADPGLRGGRRQLSKAVGYLLKGLVMLSKDQQIS
jgi:hypothetical protein